MAPFSYARRAILWRHNMVPFNGAILWHVCTRHLPMPDPSPSTLTV